jgi:hypothetical protein
MKNLFLRLSSSSQKIVTFVLLLFLFSASHAQYSVDIRCKGDCTLESQIPSYCGIESSQGDNVQCTCDNCVMIIIFKKNGTVIEENNEAYKKDLASRDMFLKDLNAYIKERHSEEEFIINSINLQTDEKDTYSVFYDYTTNSGTSGTVLFARVGGEKWIADCTGTCDCRERFIFSEPPAVECSCNDCELEVTKTKDTGGN